MMKIIDFFENFELGKKVKFLKFVSSFPIAILKYSQLRLICNRTYRIFVQIVCHLTPNLTAITVNRIKTELE